MTFNEKLIKLRKASGMSQEDLAEKIDVSRQAISKWELGDAVPDSDKIIILSEIFNVTTDYLLKDEIENPTATIIMHQDPSKNVWISKILRFFSTLLYAIGLLTSWVIWVKECNQFIDCYGRYPMALIAILIGLLVQSLGVACYYFANNFHKTKLSLGQIYLNLIFLLFIPISALYTTCIDFRTAPYPYYYERFEFTLWFWILYIVVLGIIGLVFGIISKKRKKKHNITNEQ